MAAKDDESTIKHYYVDESGDGILFNRKGEVSIGKEGCSKFFILGYLDVFDPDTLDLELQQLRANLLAEPYFKNAPSMQPEAEKTAKHFHAKDDLPEVRREVFKLLTKHKLKFFAAVKNKAEVLNYVYSRNDLDVTYHYDQNELYDLLVRRLFNDKLHKESSHEIYFAKRGKSDRTAALRDALNTARDQFFEKRKINSDSAFHVYSTIPAKTPGLQAVDYFLWALQRLYVRHEDQYIELLWPSFRLIIDIDNKREANYGMYYTQKKPLTLAALLQ